MAETCVKVAGQWKYPHRAVDKAGQTIDFLLCAHRDYAAARCFFERAIDLHRVPEKIIIDKGGANTRRNRTRGVAWHRKVARFRPAHPRAILD